MVCIEHQNGIVQTAVRLKAVVQHPNEPVRLVGVGIGVDDHGLGIRGKQGRSIVIPLSRDRAVLIRPVTGECNDKTQERGVCRKEIIARHELRIEVQIPDSHLLTAVVVGVSDVLMDLAPVVGLSRRTVEGVRAVARVAHQVCQGVRVGVPAVHRGCAADERGDKAGVDDHFGVERACVQIHGCVVLREIQALLLNPVEVWHELLVDQPCIDGLQLDHDQVLPLEASGPLVVRVRLFGRIPVIQFRNDILVLRPVDKVIHPVSETEVPERVLIETGEHHALIGVGEYIIEKTDLIHIHVGGKAVCQILLPVLPDTHNAEDDDAQRDSPVPPFPAGGRSEDHRENGAQNPADKGNPHHFPRLQVGCVQVAETVLRENQGRKGEKRAPGAGKQRVDQEQQGRNPAHQAHGHPVSPPGRQPHQSRQQNRPCHGIDPGNGTGTWRDSGSLVEGPKQEIQCDECGKKRQTAENIPQPGGLPECPDWSGKSFHRSECPFTAVKKILHVLGLYLLLRTESRMNFQNLQAI